MLRGTRDLAVRRLLLTLLVCVSVVGGTVLVTLQGSPAVARIEEDDPRWDCRTMGNRVCGVPLSFPEMSVPLVLAFHKGA